MSAVIPTINKMIPLNLFVVFISTQSEPPNILNQNITKPPQIQDEIIANLKLFFTAALSSYASDPSTNACPTNPNNIGKAYQI